MRILIYGISFSPELIGIGKFTGEFADWLAEHGHEVRVVTAPPYYPAWKIWRGFSNWWYAHEQAIPPSAQSPEGSIDVIRCPLWVPHHPSGLKRLLHLASFALSSLPVVLWQARWRPDVVWTVEPTLLCSPAALLAARLCRARTWLHIQDLEVNAAFELGLLRGNFLRRVAMAFKHNLLSRFDRVSTISQRMMERALGNSVKPERRLLFPNWVDVAAIAQPPDGNRLRQKLGIPDNVIVVLYSGSMGEKQGMELLPKAATLLREKSGLVFVLCGTGPGREKLERDCKDLANVHFLELQPPSRLGELLCMANIHVLPQRADAADLVMPSKLSGMLASGRPVVATAKPGTEIASIVEGRGLVVPPEDAVALADALLILLEDPELRKRLGSLGRDYAMRHIDRNTVLARAEAGLLALVSGPR